MKLYAVRIAVIYTVIGIAWIFFSDKLSLLFSPNIQELAYFQTAKGIAYVLLTALLLFFMVRQYEKRIAASLKEKERTNADLRLLLYKVNHDLRSPLTSIEGLVNISKKDRARANTDLYLEKIGECTSVLQSLLKHLLEVGKIMEDDFKLSDGNLDIVRTVLEPHLRLYADGKNVQLRWELAPGTFKINTEALRLLIQHLVENSIRYRNELLPQAEVDIRIFPEGDFLHVEVADNGIGIADDVMPRIFELFYRGENRGGGSGIGLFVVKTVVERMKGSVQVKSKPKEGTTFIVLLPQKI